MKYSGIINFDTNNGVGFRVSLFVSGCRLKKCKYCHNKDMQNFNYGNDYTQETEDYIIKLLSNKHITGFSILGGEPMDNLQGGELLHLVKRIKLELPHIKIYCWTGQRYENLVEKNVNKEFFKYIDLLRDGEYIEELKDLNQYLQGSTNQRYINVQKSLSKGEVVEFF